MHTALAGETPMDAIEQSIARLAVLIDADNAQPGLIAPLLAEIAKYGTAHVKRAYGDWTGAGLLRQPPFASWPGNTLC
jgi:hypothetical protein